MADIQYLNYGDLQIELLALLNNLANNVQDYVSKQSWSNKRKLKFMSAYSDIMTKGIIGASNGTGQWMIDVNGDIDLNSKDKKDREMYQEAAYFIQLQMAGLPTKASQEEKKEEDKSNLPLFDNKTFTSSFINHISTSDFGGQDFNIGGKNDNWNKLDERDSSGIRGKQNRINALKNYLISYRDKFDDTKYNFEGSPFENALDFRNRLEGAINALNTPDTGDDELALNKLGLNPADWFNNGSGDPSGKYITLSDGTQRELSYAELAKYNLDLAKLKAELEAEANKKKLIQQLANRFNYAVRSNIKMVGQNPQVLALKYKNDQGILNQLSLYAQSGNITPEQWSEILGAYKFYNSKGVLLNLSKLELDSFNGLRNYNGLGPGVLKKLPGVDGLYFDTRTGLVIKAGRREQQALQPILGLLEQNTPENKQLLAANRKLDKGWETEDYLRMGAMAQDITGAIAAWLPGYGTAASGALGLTSLGTNMAADIADESLTKWDVAKNGLVNAGLAVVGMVPGLGLASKTGKWITNVAKWAPRLLTLQAIKDLPDSYNSLQKAINKPNELTNTDWRNIAYGLSVVAGLSRGASGFAKNRIYKPAFTENTEKQYTITTSKGKKTIILKLVDEIKKLNPKDKENYNQELKKILGLAEDETVNMKDISVLGKTIKEKGIDIKEENVPVGLSAKAKAYREYLENRNNAIKNGEGIYKYAPRFLPTNYDIYKGAATAQIPSFGLSDKLRNLWNPLSDKNLLKKGIKVEETPKANPKATETKSAETSKIDRLRISELKEKFGRSKTELSNPKLEYNLKQLHRSNVEIELFIKSYGENGKSSNNSFSHGYGSNKNRVKNGEITIELGDGVKFSYKVNNASEYKNNPGKVSTLRGDVARKVQEQLSSTKNVDRVKIGKILRELKRKGWLKQGGTIDKQKIQKYKEFINK